MNELRSRLKRYAKATSLNQKDLALKAGIGTSTLKDLLRDGPVKDWNPSVDILHKYLSACDRTFCDLFNFTCTGEMKEWQRIVEATKQNRQIKIMYDSFLQMVEHANDPSV